jgi:hypothetical protein
MSVASITLIVGVGVPIVVACVGWFLPERSSWPSPKTMRVWAGIIAVAAVVAAVIAPVVAILWIFVALNFTLGTRENVPFSRYPMFSRPAADIWSVQFEGDDETPVPTQVLGLAPVDVNKMFAQEARVAARRGASEAAARQAAAQKMAALVESRRPATGPWSSAPIHIVVLDYSFDSTGKIAAARTTLDVTPR